MLVKDTFADIIPLKQWCLVNSNKFGRAVEKVNGKWKQAYHSYGGIAGIATANNPEHKYWLTYEEAKEALEEMTDRSEYNGIALIVDSPIAVVDLDDCIDENGILNPLADRIVNTFSDTFIEYSKSGHGLHVYMRYSGSYMFAGTQKKTADGKIEIYTANKVVVITGKSFGEVKPLVDHTENLNELIREFFWSKTKTRLKSDYRPSFFDETSTATVIVNGKSYYVHELNQGNKSLLDSYLKQAIENEVNFLATNAEGSRHTDLLTHVTQLGKLSAYFTVAQKEEITDRLEQAYVQNNTGPRDERDLARHFRRSFEKAWLMGEQDKPRIITLNNAQNQKITAEYLTMVAAPAILSVDSEISDFICESLVTKNNHTKEISEMFNIDESYIRDCLNIGYCEKGAVIPIYTHDGELTGAKLMDTTSVETIGSNGSLWFFGKGSDVITMTDSISGALYLNSNLHTEVVAVGDCLDSNSYLAIKKYKHVIAYGSKKFLTRAKNTFNSVIPLDRDVLRSKGGFLWKWVEAAIRNNSECSVESQPEQMTLGLIENNENTKQSFSEILRVIDFPTYDYLAAPQRTNGIGVMLRHYNNEYTEHPDSLNDLLREAAAIVNGDKRKWNKWWNDKRKSEAEIKAASDYMEEHPEEFM